MSPATSRRSSSLLLVAVASPVAIVHTKTTASLLCASSYRGSTYNKVSDVNIVTNKKRFICDFSILHSTFALLTSKLNHEWFELLTDRKKHPKVRPHYAFSNILSFLVFHSTKSPQKFHKGLPNVRVFELIHTCWAIAVSTALAIIASDGE